MKAILALVAGMLVLVTGFGAALLFLPGLAHSSSLTANLGTCGGIDTVTVPTDTGGFSTEQLRNASIIDQAAKAAGLSGQATLVGLTAALGESDLVDLGYGDAAGPDSAGVFQQRPSQGWGTRAQVLDVAYAAASFFLGPQHDGTGGLVAITGWTGLPITEAIHRVQHNADPAHYTRYVGRAEAIAKTLGLDLARPATKADTSPAPASACGGTLALGTGPCPLDAPGTAVTCDAALSFVSQQMTSGSHDWYRRCLALVSQAYGGVFSGYPTAYSAAAAVRAAGLMQPPTTDYIAIPRGAVLWFDGTSTGNSAGHVAISIGGGQAISNDAPINDGRVGVVPIAYFVAHWGQTFMGWSTATRPTHT